MITITARWFDDVFPPDVARAQSLWELFAMTQRLRACGVGIDEIVERLGPMPPEMHEVIYHETSPVEWYLAEDYLRLLRVFAPKPKRRDREVSDRLSRTIEALLDDPERLAAARADAADAVRRAKERSRSLKAGRAGRAGRAAK